MAIFKLLAEKGFKTTIVANRFPNESSYELLSGRTEVFKVLIKMIFLILEIIIISGV